MDFWKPPRHSLRKSWQTALVAVCIGGQLIGCQFAQPVHYFGDADLQYYKHAATQIDYPHVHTAVEPAAHFSEAPPTVRDPSTQEVWDLTLQDAIQMALQESQVIKARGAFKSPANPLMSSPERVASRYDTAIQETSANPIQPGIETALAAFDAQLATSMKWGRDEQLQNNFFLGGGLGFGNDLVTETAQFRSSVGKVMAHGGAFEVSHNWNYLYSNPMFQLFPSTYRGNVRADYRQPLLAGAGTDYTRIAGPYLRSLPGLNATGGGVLIARINSDISVADFELNVVNLVRDIEDLYWELYLAYRTYDAELSSREAALQFWRNTKRRQEAGAQRGSVSDEVQARDAYFVSRLRVENALGTLYATEGQLRRMLHLPVNDGRIIRPADEPIAAEYVVDWRMALAESLVNRVELRRQKWQIKSLELQLQAAENLIKPRLDFIAGYQVNGFGDQLLAYNSDDGITDRNLRSAYTTLTRGDQTGWDLGFEMSLPVGLRSAMANKRNLELRLAKQRAVLSTQELEISHELGHAFQLLDWWYQLAETNFHRQIAASKKLSIIEKEYDNGRAPIDLLLRVRAEVAAADVGYFSALVKYNQALTDLRVRKGTLLEENSIFLAEGGWEPQAYDEALRRAWARSYAKPGKGLSSEPHEFVEHGKPGPAIFEGTTPYPATPGAESDADFDAIVPPIDATPSGAAPPDAAPRLMPPIPPAVPSTTAPQVLPAPTNPAPPTSDRRGQPAAPTRVPYEEPIVPARPIAPPPPVLDSDQEFLAPVELDAPPLLIPESSRNVRPISHTATPASWLPRGSGAQTSPQPATPAGRSAPVPATTPPSGAWRKTGVQ